MKLTVVPTKGLESPPQFDIEVDGDSNGKDLLAVILAKLGWSSATLVFAGILINESQSLAGAGIEEGSTVHAVAPASVPGFGGPTTPSAATPVPASAAAPGTPASSTGSISGASSHRKPVREPEAVKVTPGFGPVSPQKPAAGAEGDGGDSGGGTGAGDAGSSSAASGSGAGDAPSDADATAAGAAASASGGSAGGSGAAAGNTGFVSAEEIPRAVVATGVPAGDSPQQLQEILLDVFGRCGSVSRIITQSDVRHKEKRLAIVVFHDLAAAATAVSLDQQEINGAPVHVFLASALSHGGAEDPDKKDAGADAGGDAGGSSSAGGGSGAGAAGAAGAGAAAAAASTPATKYSEAQQAIAKMLAQGYVTTKKGLEGATVYVQSFNRRYGVSQAIDDLSQKIQGGVRSIDARFGLTEMGQGLYKSAAGGIAGIDAQYDVSGKAKAAGQAAVGAAHSVGKAAMKNDTVRSVVGGLGSMFGAAGSYLKGTADQTVAETRKLEEEQAAPAEGGSKGASASADEGK